MGSLRSDEQWAKYQEYKSQGGLGGGCRLCEIDSMKEFGHWRIVKNKFPYDNIADVHDMIVPKRHVTEDDLSDEEWEEYKKLKSDYLNTHYDFIIEATHKIKSIPGHVHWHLIVAKP